MLANTEHVSVGRTERDGSGYGHKSVRINTTGDHAGAGTVHEGLAARLLAATEQRERNSAQLPAPSTCSGAPAEQGNCVTGRELSQGSDKIMRLATTHHKGKINPNPLKET